MTALSLNGIESSLDIPLIVTSEEFDFYWKVMCFIEQLSSMSPRIFEYCNKEVILKLFVEDNALLNAILHQSLESIKSYLEGSGRNYRLGVYLARDAEVSDWERITILINMEYETVEEKMASWEAIESRIKDIINRFKREHEANMKKVERANVLISTTLKKLQSQSV